MDNEHDKSDKRPDGAPPEQATDAEEGQADAARGTPESSAGVPNEDGQATGNPANAG